jgi:hypothetical protein
MTMVLFVPRGETRLVLDCPGRFDRLFAHLRSRTLDAQLAAGRAPETGRLLAIRAAMLTTPQARARLATYWEEVLSSAAMPQGLLAARVSVATQQARVAEAGITRLVQALRAPQPVAAQGIALASELLRDGGGPLYNPASPRDLVTEVRNAKNRLFAVISVG